MDRATVMAYFTPWTLSAPTLLMLLFFIFLPIDTTGCSK